MRERGLKPSREVKGRGVRWVAPHAGAWIETPYNMLNTAAIVVAPHAGAWIETGIFPPGIKDKTGRSPCGSVD